MRFSAWAGSASPWAEIAEETRHIEKTGWDGIWLADHFMPNREDNLGPTQEVWTMLAALAASVPRLRLGSLVTGNTYRYPAVLAKQVAQVDVISGGRVVLGIGAGWQENEHKAYDIPYYTVGTRLRRMEEAVQIIRSLFDNERTNFEGKHYSIVDAPLAPKPVQARLPILIGGGGEQVTMRLAAKYADEWNVWGTPETIKHKMEVLDRHCEEIGRNPRDIKRSAQVTVTITDDAEVASKALGRPGFPVIAGPLNQIKDKVGQYAAMGLDEFILPDFTLGRTVEERKESYDRFIEDIAPAFR